jgi:GR25 family glycosyltransferase involved in LPS biosynthesis
MGNSTFQVQPANNGSTVYTTYINLAHRTDRKQDIESELQRIGITEYHRFDAIKKAHGSLGCSLSQIAALEQGMASGADHIVILEDDFQFLVSPKEYRELLAALCHIDYDVMELESQPAWGHLSATTHPLLQRVTKSCNTGGYIVNKKYAATLLENYKLGAKLLEVLPQSHFCVDIFKIMLEKRDKWFCYYKQAARQRPSYSDIEHKFRDRP